MTGETPRRRGGEVRGRTIGKGRNRRKKGEKRERREKYCNVFPTHLLHLSARRGSNRCLVIINFVFGPYLLPSGRECT